MSNGWLVDGVRTPVGRYGGGLSKVRADDLGALPIVAIMERYPSLDPASIDDVIYGCVNQAGEDNRNVARMSALLAGLPTSVPGMTINRLCGSGLDAVGTAARALRTGEVDIVLAGGVEHMTRAPFVVQKPDAAFTRSLEFHDTTIGWRFVNPRMKSAFGDDSMPQTADNVAADYGISREDQDRFAFQSQERWQAAVEAGRFHNEIVPVTIKQRKGEDLVFDKDEHPRPGTTMEQLAKLSPINGVGCSVTAGNASGVNDGAAALLMVSDDGLARNNFTPLARVVGMAVAGVEPRVMGIGPVPAVRKVLSRTGLDISQMDVIELNEAFAAQGLAVLRELGLPDDAPHVNANGGAIAVGHPLGASGARLALTAARELQRVGGQYALCTMCIGVGQGIALVLERP